jgi:hypothetical protein
MKHTTEEFFAIARRYYPSGIESHDPRYKESEEHARLVTARRGAGARRDVWRAMLDRLSKQFPDRDVYDDVLACPPEWLRAGYEGSIFLPEATGEHGHTVAFMVSFLAPYYLVCSTRTVDDPEAEAARRAKHEKFVTFCIDNVFWALHRGMVTPEFAAEADKAWEAEHTMATRRDISFAFTPDEQPYAESIAREIEAVYGFERMPPEVGNIIVPDVSVGGRLLGEARLFDCLFSDSW